MRNAGLLFALLLTFLAWGCSQNDKNFTKEFRLWQDARIEGLKSETGWLNLAGLYWLEEGENTIGSDSSNSIIFPESAPGRIGKYILDSSDIYFMADPEAGVMKQGTHVSTLKIATDKSGHPTILQTGRFAWFIIERSAKFGIRLRDYENPSIENFHGIETYPPDRDWVVRAVFEPYDKPHELLIPTLIGTIEKNMCPGILHFRINGTEYKLYPSEAGYNLFIIFADETSGTETYGGGRFLYTGLPDKQGLVYIDFNRAYNPPCAFTPFATCPLPPRENILSTRIEAGEKFTGH